MNKYTFNEIEIGLKESFEVSITSENMRCFCQMTGDENPLHNSQEFSKQKGFENCVVYGMLTASYLSTLAGVYLPGEKSLIQSVEINFTKPVFVGDRLTITGEVVEKNELFQMIKMKVTITNSKNEKVVRGKMQVGVLA